MGKYPYFPSVSTQWKKKQKLDSLSIKEITTPSNPDANYMKLYFKADGKLYKLNSSGVETVSNSTVSAITQALLDAKANIASPTFTGTVAIPNVANLETAVVANTAKTGITGGQASAITANTAKTGITGGQASAITANTAKTGITAGQASAITANTAKTGITAGQASAITANTAKTGITAGQASAIVANTAKVSLEDNSVTLTKLAHGTADKYLGFDGSGNPAELTVTAGGGQEFDTISPTNSTLADYTGFTSGNIIVSSDPDLSSSLSGQSASSTQWGRALYMDNLKDGNDNSATYNDMGTPEGATVVIDMGSSRTEAIKGVFHCLGNPTVHLESSTDNVSWTTRASLSVTDEDKHELTNTSITFRYLRLRTVSFAGAPTFRAYTLGIDKVGSYNLYTESTAGSWNSSSESTPYLYFDMGSNKELASIALNLNRTLTTVTSLTFEYSTDTTFSGELIRTVLVSDFTDDTDRFINIPRSDIDKRYCKIAGVGTGVLSVNYVKYLSKTSAEFERNHFHKYLTPTATTANTEDSN